MKAVKDITFSTGGQVQSMQGLVRKAGIDLGDVMANDSSHAHVHLWLKLVTIWSILPKESQAALDVKALAYRMMEHLEAGRNRKAVSVYEDMLEAAGVGEYDWRGESARLRRSAGGDREA